MGSDTIALVLRAPSLLQTDGNNLSFSSSRYLVCFFFLLKELLLTATPVPQPRCLVPFSSSSGPKSIRDD